MSQSDRVAESVLLSSFDPKCLLDGDCEVVPRSSSYRILLILRKPRRFGLLHAVWNNLHLSRGALSGLELEKASMGQEKSLIPCSILSAVLPSPGGCEVLHSITVHDGPPRGYFKCYEVHLLRCHLWFPIPEIFVQTLNHLVVDRQNLSLRLAASRREISHELRVRDDTQCQLYRGFLFPNTTKVPLQYCFKPRKDMIIIKGFASNMYDWQDYYFFVRIDSASISEEFIPIFRGEWNRNGIIVEYSDSFFVFPNGCEKHMLCTLYFLTPSEKCGINDN